MPRDSKNLTDTVEYFDPLSQDQKAKARLTVCCFAEDAEDAANLMLALGIHPSQEDEVSPVGVGLTPINS